jgi:hypothetical protein
MRYSQQLWCPLKKHEYGMHKTAQHKAWTKRTNASQLVQNDEIYDRSYLLCWDRPRLGPNIGFELVLGWERLLSRRNSHVVIHSSTMRMVRYGIETNHSSIWIIISLFSSCSLRPPPSYQARCPKSNFILHLCNLTGWSITILLATKAMQCVEQYILCAWGRYTFCTFII